VTPKLGRLARGGDRQPGGAAGERGVGAPDRAEIEARQRTLERVLANGR
jgi:hypothetical protein